MGTGARTAARPGHKWLRVEGYANKSRAGLCAPDGIRGGAGANGSVRRRRLTYSPDQILSLLDVLRNEPEVDLVLASAYMPEGASKARRWGDCWPAGSETRF